MVNTAPRIYVTPELFWQLCQVNPELRLERTATGELVIMSPTGGETGRSNAKLISRFVVWNEQNNLGEVFDSSTCFRLPNGGDRSPDVAWVERSR
ncbi:MAG: Uma2 family endonuclease, partial [Oscillatoriales cyanobacterium RM1_1_9]|nr:Uma2 family endonuclease [Oscillatoriales cyanobacterium RM1_1_9]